MDKNTIIIDGVEFTVKHIKKYKIGDRVTSGKSIWIDKGFRNVSGEIVGYRPDEVNSIQYVVHLDDNRVLFIDDWLLK